MSQKLSVNNYAWLEDTSQINVENSNKESSFS